MVASSPWWGSLSAVGGGVAGPVAASCVGPSGGGSGMQSEEFAEDGGWEFSGEFEQGAVAVGSGIDAERADPSGEGVGVQGLTRTSAGEQLGSGRQAADGPAGEWAG